MFFSEEPAAVEVPVRPPFMQPADEIEPEPVAVAEVAPVVESAGGTFNVRLLKAEKET